MLIIGWARKFRVGSRAHRKKHTHAFLRNQPVGSALWYQMHAIPFHKYGQQSCVQHTAPTKIPPSSRRGALALLTLIHAPAFLADALSHKIYAAVILKRSLSLFTLGEQGDWSGQE
jgi:hypothetical protein